MASPYGSSRYIAPANDISIADEDMMLAASDRYDPNFADAFLARRQAARQQTIPASVEQAAPVVPTATDPAARRGHNREMLSNAGIAAGFQAAQAAVELVPTSMDRTNTKRIKELEARKDAGRLGLEPDEAALFDRALGGARALARDSSQQQEARLAASGSRTSAGALSRVRRDGDAAMLQQATEVGARKAEANMQAKAAQLQELEQRRAAKDARQKQALGSLSSLIAGTATLTGQVKAGQAAKQLNMANLDLSAADKIALSNALYSRPGQAQQMIELFTGTAPQTAK